MIGVITINRFLTTGEIMTLYQAVMSSIIAYMIIIALTLFIGSCLTIIGYQVYSLSDLEEKKSSKIITFLLSAFSIVIGIIFLLIGVYLIFNLKQIF